MLVLKNQWNFLGGDSRINPTPSITLSKGFSSSAIYSSS